MNGVFGILIIECGAIAYFNVVTSDQFHARCCWCAKLFANLGAV